MKFRKWLARVGAVGGTARWAANGYWFFRKQHPERRELSDSEILRLLVKKRYGQIDKATEELVLDTLDPSRGLQGLVTLILIVEAGFSDNDFTTQMMFHDVIVEELRRRRIPDTVISGSDPHSINST